MKTWQRLSAILGICVAATAAHAEPLRWTLEPSQVDAIGWHATAVIPAPPALVWSVVTDYDHYTRFVPMAEESGIVKADDEGAVTRMVYRNPWPLQNVVMLNQHRHEIAADHYKMSWTTLETNLSNSFGYWEIQPVPNNPRFSQIVYEMNFNVEWVPRSLALEISRGRAKAVVEAVRDEAMRRQREVTAQIAGR